MVHNFRYFILPVFLVLLSSCATTDKDVAGPGEGEQGSYKYKAWQLVKSSEFDAISVLLKDADMLIENHAYNAAADKLERVLRIKPDYAPAWSRLSWLALQMNSPQHSIQMAKRSNSFAVSDTELQLLNWSFIGDASKALGDEENYSLSKQKIESLNTF